MKQYLELLDFILKNGVQKGDRTGTGTLSVFGYQMRFNLEDGFPLMTTKKTFMKGITHELIWFLKGETNIKYLVDNDVKIWNEWPYQAYLKANQLESQFPKYSKEWSEKLDWFVSQIKSDVEFAKKWGELGPVYGYQWRNFNGQGVDQIKKVQDTLRKDPNSRRILVVAYNPAQADEMAKSGLPPCHALFQFYVANGKLSCQLYQRSCDVFLGVPFNIASYALLTMMMAQATGLKPGEFVWTGGDTHIYLNHLEQVKEQLSRTPKKLPVMKINPEVKDIFDFKYEDFILEGYDPWPMIKAPISV